MDVRPFNYLGPAEDAWLGGGVTEIVRAALDGAPEWRLATVMLAGRAGLVVEGSVVVLGRGVRITSRLRDGSGVALRSFEHRGSTLEPSAAVDSIAADLAREMLLRLGRTAVRRAELAGSSTRALRAFAAGETAGREGRWQESADSLVAALEADSTFGLAYYRLWVAATAGATVGSFGDASRIIRSAMRVETRLTPRQRDIFRTLSAAYDGDRAAALAGAEALERLWPDDPHARYATGEVYFHLGPGPAWRTRSMGQFEAALRQDSSLAEAYAHVVSLRVVAGDSAGAWSALRSGIARAPDWAQLQRIELAMRVGLSRQPAAHIGDSLFRTLPESRARSLLYRAADEETMRLFEMRPLQALATAREFYAVLEARERSATARMIAAAEQSVLAAAQGQHHVAWAQLDRMEAVTPANVEVLVFQVMLAARTGTGLDRGRRALDALRLRNLDTLDYGRALEGWLGWAAGDTSLLSGAAAALRARSGAEAHGLSDGLSGWLALLRGDSVAARDRLRAALDVQTYSYSARSPERAMTLTLARLELAAGNPAGAERALDLVYLGRDGLFYQAEADEIRASSALARNDREAARQALQRELGLWAWADPELQPRVSQARATLAQLTP